MKLPARIGMLGCGNISSQYLRVARTLPDIEIVACSDQRMEAAEQRAQEFQVPRILEPESLLSDNEIDIILNLTPPGAHYEMSLASLEAGKSVYCEKPLALEAEEGRHLVAVAEEKGLRIGCAPDTFLGAGFQSARTYLDEGLVGDPVAATAFLMSRGHEHWHPNPEFYYLPGGGPMFDMGPYYLTALVHLLGPVERVTGSARVSFPQRTIGSEPLRGQVIDVQVPTHVTGILDFESGVVATLITTFDVQASGLPRMELFGSQGTLSLPDPNTFGGPLRVRSATDDDWRDLELTHENRDASRGLGLADMARAIVEGRPHRASGDLALHVLEIMEAIHVASREGRHIPIQSRVSRPMTLPRGLDVGHVGF